MVRHTTPPAPPSDHAAPDLIWHIVKNAGANTANRQRWTKRRIAGNVALLLAILLIAWLTGHLNAVSEKAEFAVIVAAAVALVFVGEFVPQLFIATYRAGQGVSGNTDVLKRLYMQGDSYRKGRVPESTNNILIWQGMVQQELIKTLPSELFGFVTVADELPSVFGGDRTEHLKLQLAKLRAILMRADEAAKDE